MTDKLDIIGVIEVLTDLTDDSQVPRNIKERISSVIETLNEDKEASIKVDKALQALDEIGDDPNLQTFTRTQIWNVVSMLEKS